MKVSCLYLDAEEYCEREIAFELVPWELTYELSLSPGKKIEEIFFRDEQTNDISEPFETLELQVDDLVLESEVEFLGRNNEDHKNKGLSLFNRKGTHLLRLWLSE